MTPLHPTLQVFSQRRTHVIFWRGANEGLGGDGNFSGGTTLEYMGLHRRELQASSSQSSLDSNWPELRISAGGLAHCLVAELPHKMTPRSAGWPLVSWQQTSEIVSEEWRASWMKFPWGAMIYPPPPVKGAQELNAFPSVSGKSGFES